MRNFAAHRGSNALRILTLSAVMLGTIGVVQSLAAQQSPVLAQDLRKLRVPEKVSAVIWTRREQQLTLQILVNDSRRTGRIQAASRDTARDAAQNSDVIHAWLLRSDGTQIPSTDRRETKRCSKEGIRCLGYEVQYSFPLSVARDAVAVAIEVNDKFLIENLEAFPEH